MKAETVIEQFDYFREDHSGCGGSSVVDSQGNAFVSAEILSQDDRIQIIHYANGGACPRHVEKNK